MAVKITQWLALAMLLSVAVVALAAQQEDAAKPTSAPVDASIAAKKYKDNYHKEDYHKEDYHKGGEYYPKGGEYYPKGGEYYPKGGEYYPGEEYPSNKGDYGYYQDAGYGNTYGTYPNYGSHSNYPSYPNYGYSSNEYPHDGYEYGHDNYYSSYNKGHYIYLPKPSDRTLAAVPCPAPTNENGWGTCTVKCFGPSTNGVFELGCFVEGSTSLATLTCPGETKVVNCDCDCSGNNQLTACVSTNIGGVRKTCLSMCASGNGQVRALCQ